MNMQELSAIVALLTDNTIHQMALADLLHKKGVVSRVELGEHIDKFTKSYHEMIAERLTKDFFNMTFFQYDQRRNTTRSNEEK